MPKVMFMGYMQPTMKRFTFSRFLRERCELGREEASSIVDDLLFGRSVSIEMGTLRKAYRVAAEAGELGIKCGVVREG